MMTHTTNQAWEYCCLMKMYQFMAQTEEVKSRIQHDFSRIAKPFRRKWVKGQYMFHQSVFSYNLNNLCTDVESQVY